VRPTRGLFPVRRLPNGHAYLNLGSSTRCAPQWNNLDFSWIVRLAGYPRLAAILHRYEFLSEDRYARIRSVGSKIIQWNLRKGIPFSDASFDGVYHSHLLEHMDREVAPMLLRECLRVLKPGAILRVVVPDLELLTRRYLSVVDNLPLEASAREHEASIEALIDQMIVRVPHVRSEQKTLVKWLENIFVGNTARAGVIHRWMYDHYSLGRLLSELGFVDVKQESATTSSSGMVAFALDVESDGSPYKPESLYMEGRRPDA